MGEKNMASKLGRLRSCPSNIPIEALESIAFCKICWASFGLKWCRDRNMVLNPFNSFGTSLASTDFVANPKLSASCRVYSNAGILG